MPHGSAGPGSPTAGGFSPGGGISVGGVTGQNREGGGGGGGPRGFTSLDARAGQAGAAPTAFDLERERRFREIFSGGFLLDTELTPEEDASRLAVARVQARQPKSLREGITLALSKVGQGRQMVADFRDTLQMTPLDRRTTFPRTSGLTPEPENRNDRDFGLGLQKRIEEIRLNLSPGGV